MAQAELQGMGTFAGAGPGQASLGTAIEHMRGVIADDQQARSAKDKAEAARAEEQAATLDEMRRFLAESQAANDERQAARDAQQAAALEASAAAVTRLEAKLASFVAEGGAGVAAAMVSQERRLREEAEAAAASRVRRIEQTVARSVARLRLGAQSKAWEAWVRRAAARRRQNLLRKTAGRMRSLELSRHFQPWATLARARRQARAHEGVLHMAGPTPLFLGQ